MTVASKTAALTKAINDTVKEFDITEASLDAQVSSVETFANAAVGFKDTAVANRDTTATHAATVAAHLATVNTNVTYEDIAAIAASKVETAVDVFVYDTSLDSDGGAWRKRCQHTSWYNETLNTATRGSRREFPAVAVIVAESNKVTIYDGDDPTLPMWMVFNGATAWNYMFTFGNAPSGVTSVACLNGRLAITTTSSATNASTNGVFEIVFPADTGFKTRAVGRYKWQTNIADRNASTTASWLNNTIIGPAIVSDYLNDVAMTVLPDAPIDSETGLPVPTIAVGTAGGTSIIKDNGTVVDILNYSNHRTMRVAFDSKNRLFIHEAHPTVTGYGAVVQFNSLPDSDVTTLLNNHPDGDVLYDVNYNGWNLPRTVDSNYYGFRSVSAGKDELALGSHTTGLSRLKYGQDGDGLAAFHGQDHAAYYAPRNIKGVFLAETDTTSLTATVELNDDADMLDNSLWSYPANGVDWSVSGQVTITEQNGGDVYLTRDISSVVVGKYYRIEVEYTNSTTSGSGNRIYFAGGAYYVLSQTSVPTTRVFYAIARSGQNLGILLSATNATTTVLRMSVKEVDFDRHRNPLGAAGGPAGLIVNGTVTRSPVATGAELVGYSGFSSTNYLEQPYNSALDFGTGDFSAMGWHKKPGINVTGGLIKRLDAADGGAGFNVYHFGYFNTTVTLFNGVGGSKTITATLKDGWQHVCVVRKGDVLSLYSDGVLAASVTGVAAYDLSNVNGILKIGSDGTGSVMALWRISATAPTADQIRKIYEDERRLFQPGAQCTLYGTSDAVTALAHDPKTNLLHVGTSAGRSTFDGLVRVDNTTNPVGTAISAVNGLIVEE